MAMIYAQLLLTAVLVLCLTAAAGADAPAAGPEELVRNGDFAAAGKQRLPAHWSAWQPVWKRAACTVRRTADGLLVEGARAHDVGGVEQKLRGVRGGRAYTIQAACELRKIPSPYRSVMVRLNWTRKGKLLHPAGMLVRGPVVTGTGARFDDVLVAPKAADGALLSLEVKWPTGGTVLWKRVSVRPAPAPPPRKVKIGTVYLRPKRSTPQRNLDLFCKQIDAAGKLKLDIVCLSEAITTVGTTKNAADVAEPIPGPASRRLGKAAARNRIWVVAGLTEREGDAVYNTAVLLDRGGRLAGKYRKVHLPREEWKKGITPAGEYPVFRTDFGTIAIQICYDWFFPEPASIFALRGAEILFAPTWGNTLPDQDGRVRGETVFRVRARDNGLYMVPSVYDGSSMVIDPMGRILASNKGREGVFWCEVDLSVREPLWWVGYWRSIGPRDRMPHTYKPLTKEPRKPTY